MTRAAIGRPSFRRAREAAHLRRLHSRPAERRRAHDLVREMGRLEGSLLEHEGIRLRGLRMVDLGCGQFLRNALYFAQRNEVFAVSREVIPRPWRPDDYARMVRRNGWLRTAKTAGRKLLGADAAFRSELAALLGVPRLRWPSVHVVPAAALPLSDASVDVVYSNTTLEHERDPRSVVAETARVLRPGGVAYLCPQLWTSYGGSHDPRVLAGSRDAVPPWAHLREPHGGVLLGDAWINPMRLAEWRQLFREVLPGCRFEYRSRDRTARAEQLRAVRAQGELAAYSDEELLTTDIAAIWRKPR